MRHKIILILFSIILFPILRANFASVDLPRVPADSRAAPQRGSASQSGSSDWPAYGRDPGGSRFSPASAINRSNVSELKIAWTYRTGASEVKAASAGKAAFEATPILVDGTLYLTTPFNRVIALEPQTGRERWSYDPQVDLKRGYSEMTSRGVSAWPGPDLRNEKAARRIFLATVDARLIALDAATGSPVAGFGERGVVDLTRDVRMTDRGDYQVTSPPAVIGDLVIVGSSIGDNRGVELERGVVRAYDARTGRLRWSWDPIPKDAKDPARRTWAGESAERTGAANAWSIISVDARLGLVYVPTSSPSPDFYGGERKGDNLYANSVVALRAASGEVAWHFQVVHHDLWDYDVAAQPMLIDIKRGGQSVPAVAIGTKMGMIFVLDRRTGKPIFPVEERRVPQTDVEGEQSSPTQPFPSLPRPLVPHQLKAEDAWGVTEADRASCREQIAALRNEGIYTPPSLKGTLLIPGNVGGLNWSGMSFDPGRGLLFANTNNLPFKARLIVRADYQKEREAGASNRLRGEFARQTGTPYAVYREPLRAPSGMPCIAPPWGKLTAIDMATGEVRWETPLGRMPQTESVPEAEKWGSINLGGSVVTAGGLVFIAAGMDTKLRAFDVETGKELWAGELPASAQAAPMTYTAGGKQFVLICAGGHGKLGTKMGDYVVAFSR